MELESAGGAGAANTPTGHRTNPPPEADDKPTDNGDHPADAPNTPEHQPEGDDIAPSPADEGANGNDGGGNGGGGGSGGPTWYGTTSALIWVFLWICLAVWMAMGTLASNQFHDDLDALRQSGGNEYETSLVSLDQRVRLLQQLEATDRSAQELRFQLSSVEKELKITLKKKEDFDNKLEATNKKITALEEKQSFLGEQLLVALPDHAIDLAAELEKSRRSLEEIAPLKLRFESNINEVGVDIDRLTARKTDINAKIFVIEAETARTRGELATSPELTKLANDQQKSRLLYLSFFFAMPKNIVILMLALAMGALGSTIHLSRTAFGSSHKYPVSWYVMRPFHGMVLALAMYIMVKSGQYAVMEPSAANEDLNPFTISLLAIVSGLFSEKAYERLQRASEAVFEPKEPK